MKKIYKALLFIVSLAGLVLSAGILSLFYYIPHVSEAVTACRFLFPWADIALAGFAVFIPLCFAALLLTALLVPAKSDYLIVTKDNGKLRFSRQTVESTVRYSIADVEGISASRVRASIKKAPEKTRIYVQLILSGASNVTGLTEAVRGRIDSALKASLGVEAKLIDIKVAELGADNKPVKQIENIIPAETAAAVVMSTDAAEETDDSAKVSRVI